MYVNVLKMCCFVFEIGCQTTPWLPRRSNLEVLSPALDSLYEAKVEILIEGSHRQWNHGLIDGIFTREEATLIKSLPLSQTGQAHSLLWPHTNNGNYTWKTGYQFLKQKANSDPLGFSLLALPRNLKQIYGEVFSLYMFQIKSKTYCGGQPVNHFPQNRICCIEPSQIALYMIDAS